MERHEQFDLIRDWAKNKGIYAKGDTKTQFAKLAEEFGELAKAILQDNKTEIEDAIGDQVVVLTNLAKLAGTSIERCIGLAWNEIKNRNGQMINGTFVKEESLSKYNEAFKPLKYKCIDDAGVSFYGFEICKIYKSAVEPIGDLNLKINKFLYLENASGYKYYVKSINFKLVE